MGRTAQVLSLSLLAATTATAQSLDRAEQRMRATIAGAREDQIAYLQRVVDIPSSTLNFEGDADGAGGAAGISIGPAAAVAIRADVRGNQLRV